MVPNPSAINSLNGLVTRNRHPPVSPEWKESQKRQNTLLDDKHSRISAESLPILSSHLVLGDPVPVQELKLEADVLDGLGAPLATAAAAVVDALQMLRQVKDERLVEDRVQRLFLHVRLLLRARALLVAQHVDLDVGI